MPSMAITTLIKAASVLALAQQALGACYRPDGTDRNISPWIKDGETPYQPCKNSGGGHSMCCNVKSADECRDNGLCYTGGTKLLWRESCTDPTWKDPACLKLCSGANQMTEDGKAMSGIDSVITVCSGDSQLCCGSGDFAQKCCDANKGFFIVNGNVVEAHPTPKTTAKPAPATTVTPEKETVTKTKQADPSPDTNSGGDTGGNTGGNTGGSNGGNTGGSNGGSNGGDSGGSNGGNNNSGDNSNDRDSNTGDNNNGGSGTSPTESPDKEESTPGAGEEDGTKSESGVGAKASPPANSSEDSDDDADPTGKGKEGLASTKDASDDASSDNTDENDTGSATPSGSGSKKNGHSNGSSGGGEGEDGGGTATDGSTGKSSALIGGVVGGVLGGIILFAITAWFVIRKRRATKGERYVNTLGSASELPGTEGKTFYEVPGDYKFPVAQLPTRTQTRKGGELPVVESYHEMQVGSPVSR